MSLQWPADHASSTLEHNDVSVLRARIERNERDLANGSLSVADRPWVEAVIRDMKRQLENLLKNPRRF